MFLRPPVPKSHFSILVLFFAIAYSVSVGFFWEPFYLLAKTAESEIPPQFVIKNPAQPIRVLAFGDFGDGSKKQKEVAAAMADYHKGLPFDFGITLGDNFYEKGVKGLNDPRWKSWWSDLYDPLQIKFFAVLGNHDYGFRQSPQAEIAYTEYSRSWKMPARYYQFGAGPADFFALDTVKFDAEQAAWLKRSLAASSQLWKIVYGHHPIFSHGHHGDSEELIRDLLPILLGKAHIYLAGHDHDMQHLKPEGNLHFIVAGCGAHIRPIKPGPRSLFAHSALGFAVIEATKDVLKVQFVEKNLKPVYAYTLTPIPEGLR